MVDDKMIDEIKRIIRKLNPKIIFMGYLIRNKLKIK